LKRAIYFQGLGMQRVAPRTGAWIETTQWLKLCHITEGRPPHGGVD